MSNIIEMQTGGPKQIANHHQRNFSEDNSKREMINESIGTNLNISNDPLNYHSKQSNTSKFDSNQQTNPEKFEMPP